MQRGCKTHVAIENVFTTFDASHVNVNTKYQNALPLISSTVSGLANANWRAVKELAKRDIDEHIKDIVIPFCTPIIERIAIQSVLRF